MPNVTPPSSGLGSNSNYLLFNNCNNLPELSVTIGVGTDIVASAGFGFQLNAYSPQNETCVIQQYCIVVDTSGQMSCIVNNWQNVSTPLINNWVQLYQLPSATLPAGYQCMIGLDTDNAGNITAASFSVIGVQPEPGGALSSFADNMGEHVFYVGTDQHVHQLSWNTQAWADQDLSRSTGGPLALAGSGISSFGDDLGEHVFYVGNDQRVHQLFWNTTVWADQDLSAGGPLVVAGSGISSFADNLGEHVFYVGTDQHVHQLYWNTQFWDNQDLSGSTGGPLVAAESGISSFADNEGEHVFYAGTDQHVHQLFWNTAVWADQDLSHLTGGPLAVAARGISSFADNEGEHVFYMGNDTNAHQLYWNSNKWVDQNLTNVVYASVTQTLLEISGVSSADLSPIVAFELDIVGFDNGQSTTLSSGSGTIVYTALNAMTVVNAEPSCCEFDGGTEETANTAYGELPTGSSNSFVQTFNTSSATIKAPKRNALIKTKPSVIVSRTASV